MASAGLLNDDVAVGVVGVVDDDDGIDVVAVDDGAAVWLAAA
jgi:hypothetical protein